MNKYKVGQKVRIRPDLNRKEHDHSPGLTNGMMQMKGQIVTIRNTWGEEYKIHEDAESGFWLWHEDWLIPVSVNQEEAFEMLVRGEITEKIYKELIKGE